MKPKTIKQVLKKKMDLWLNSITDEQLKINMRQDIIVTGGCITSMLLNEDINDFDVYFRTKKTTKDVAEYYANIMGINTRRNISVIDLSINPIRYWDPDNDDKEKNTGKIYQHLGGDIRMFIKSSGIVEDLDDPNIANEELIMEHEEGIIVSDEPIEKELFQPVFISDNAISLSGMIQIVTRFYGEPEEIHKNFDFVHCTCYWEYKCSKLTTPNEALLAMMNKDLIYTGSLFPICSIIRTRKFIKRDWKISAGQYLKMAWQISQLNLNDFFVLKDQLIGVDAAYFNMIVNALESKGMTEVDGQYLIEVIDRVFSN